jgi:phytoene synthase
MMSDLALADRECRRLSRRHGVSYYWATRLLGPDQRPHVHALYAFCRRADDIVDSLDVADVADATSVGGPDVGGRGHLRRAADLAAFRDAFERAVLFGDGDDPVLVAVGRTIRHHHLDPSLFERFLAAMAADLSITEYESWDHLLEYMDGSAAVIGEMLLPILDPVDRVAALEPARQLGLAFQLTNFLRDVGEDLDLGRTYLPREDLDRFGVELGRREVTPEFFALMRFEIERAETLYEVAATGLPMLPTRSRRCVGAALRSYRAILRRIEANEYDVFTRRASVPTTRKLLGVASELVRR